jgi:uncharacterized protein YabN with tetrapyrrole methylase and pyrophosphatase domain
MIKDKEKLIQDKTEKMEQIVRAYVEDMDILSDTDKFTIDNIEKMWQELDEKAKEIYREINREVIEQINEKEIIRLKKANTPR